MTVTQASSNWNGVLFHCGWLRETSAFAWVLLAWWACLNPAMKNLLWNEMFPTRIMTALSWINSIIDKNRRLRHRKWFVYLKCFIFYSLFEVRASSRKEEVTLHLTPQDIYGHNGVSAWTWQHLRRAKNILWVPDVSLWVTHMSTGSSLTCRRCECVLVGDYLIDKDVQIWLLKQLNKQNKNWSILPRLDIFYIFARW